MRLLKKVRVVLVSTSHPANIGATARAMKTMGFRNLHLVNPKKFPSEEAVTLASGADDILENAILHSNLSDALKGTSIAFATTARSRHISLPVSSPRMAVGEIGRQTDEVAFVFGRENSGLSNDQINLCNRIITIPSNPDFSSLNLAQAVQICLYELRVLSLAAGNQVDFSISKGDRLALSQEVQRLESHLTEVMQLVDYFHTSQPKHLIQRIHRIFGRSSLLRSEVQILRGFLSSIERKLNKKN